MKFRKMMGCIALGLTCAMIGAGATMAAQNTSAAAEAVTAANSTTTVVTSPFTAAVQQVRNSVVGVSNYQTVRYGSYGNNFYFGYGFGYGNGRNNDQQIEEREELAATGSGVVIGQGFVLTNYHVVEDASSLRVTVTDDSGNTDEYAATLVAYDESLDIAIVYATGLDLPAVTLGDSDTLQVGDWAINPSLQVRPRHFTTVFPPKRQRASPLHTNLFGLSARAKPQRTRKRTELSAQFAELLQSFTGLNLRSTPAFCTAEA